MNLPNLHKVRDVIQLYFERRDSNPISLAYYWATLPDEILEPFFETCLAFIQEIANREAHTPMMRNYREIARRMTERM